MTITLKTHILVHELADCCCGAISSENTADAHGSIDEHALQYTSCNCCYKYYLLLSLLLPLALLLATAAATKTTYHYYHYYYYYYYRTTV
jgi:hypothetical protein